MVPPGIPHPVTQPRSRRERMFVEDGVYALSLDLLAEGRREQAWRSGPVASCRTMFTS